MSAPVITVDGPGGAGKGTLCFRLASELGWHMLDSGALYRVTAHAALDAGLDLDDRMALAKAAHGLEIQFSPAAGGLTRVALAGHDISAEIRNEACGAAASRIAALPEVRAALLQRQRTMVIAPGLVADGRDMGTVVFPHAALKVFLTATVEARARRRQEQLMAQGESVNLRRLLETIEERDARDCGRSEAPLVAADDALTIDSTEMSADEVLERVLQVARERKLID